MASYFYYLWHCHFHVLFNSFQAYNEGESSSDDEDVGNGEDEDSNDENHYANEYPDSDPDGDGNYSDDGDDLIADE